MNVLLSLVAMMGAEAVPDCLTSAGVEDVRVAENLVVRRAPLVIASSVAPGPTSPACVRLEFAVTSCGLVENIKVVESSGNPKVEDGARAALGLYQFDRKLAKQGVRYTLVFSALSD